MHPAAVDWGQYDQDKAAGHYESDWLYGSEYVPTSEVVCHFGNYACGFFGVMGWVLLILFVLKIVHGFATD